MGFVKISDDLSNWRWIDDKNTTYVYLRLLLMAAWSDRFQNGVEIKRGQLVTTYPKIGEICGITARQARTIIERLKATGKVSVRIKPQFSIITMLEYDVGSSDVSQNVSRMSGECQTACQSNVSPTLYNTNIQIGKQTNTAPAAREGGVLSEYFDKFWSAYPKKTAKQGAFKAFVKLKPDEELLNKMLSSLEQQKKSVQWTKDNGQYIPYPATWLNGKRWEDEIEKTQQEVNKNGKTIGYDAMPKTREEWLKEFDL